MSSPPTIEPSKCINWEECNQFVRAIRAAAWKEGKLRDLAWVADFASLHFSHQALLWHSELPRDVRQDWEQLEVALLSQWKPPKFGDEPPIEPTPAAAPSQDRTNPVDRPLHGVLKVAMDGSNTNYYLQLGGSGRVLMQEDANQAIRIRCSSLSNTTILERIDGLHHSWLGIQWATTNPDLKNGSTDVGYLVLVNPLSFKASWRESDHPYRLASCSVSANREVTPFWENDDGSKITIGILSNGTYPYLAADLSACSNANPGWVKAKLFIQPVD